MKRAQGTNTVESVESSDGSRDRGGGHVSYESCARTGAGRWRECRRGEAARGKPFEALGGSVVGRPWEAAGTAGAAVGDGDGDAAAAPRGGEGAERGRAENDTERRTFQPDRDPSGGEHGRGWHAQ
eukprot:5585383-Pleurochrysis_carterae.AAC.2